MKVARRSWWITLLLVVAGLIWIFFQPAKSCVVWRYEGLNNWLRNTPAVGSDGTIYVGNLRDLVAINPDGSEKWKCKLPIPVGVIGRATCATNGDILVPWTSNGSSGGVASVSHSGQTNWIFNAGTVTASPVLGRDGTIYFGSSDSNFYALNPDGTERWRHTMTSPVFFQPRIDSDGTIFVTSNDSESIPLNPDGHVNISRWKAKTMEPPWLVRPAVQSPVTPTDGSSLTNFSKLREWLWKMSQEYESPSTGEFKTRTNSPKPSVSFSFDLNGGLQFSEASHTTYWRIQTPVSLWDDNSIANLTERTWFACYERDISTRTGATTATIGTEVAAVIEFDSHGNELWRTEIPGTFRWRKLLDYRNFMANWRSRFGLKEYRGLSRPVVGLDGTIYVLSNQGLLAIQPPEGR